MSLNLPAGLNAAMDGAHAHANRVLDQLLDSWTPVIAVASPEQRVVLLTTVLSQVLGDDTEAAATLSAVAVARLIDQRLEDRP